MSFRIISRFVVCEISLPLAFLSNRLLFSFFFFYLFLLHLIVTMDTQKRGQYARYYLASYRSTSRQQYNAGTILRDKHTCTLTHTEHAHARTYTHTHTRTHAFTELSVTFPYILRMINIPGVFRNIRMQSRNGIVLEYVSVK